MTDSINYKDIGKRIKIARIRCDLSQAKLAAAMNITSSHLSNIETGNAKLSLPTLVRIANVLNVSIADILCDNLKRAKEAYCNECNILLSDCSEYEVRIITDLISSTISTLRKNQTFYETKPSSVS